MSAPRADKASKGYKLSEFTYRNVTYRVGDCVLINPDAENAAPYIGRIKEITKRSTRPEDLQVTVVWFYRPEEAIGGRKPFHGDKELFVSDHQDVVHRNTVMAKCRVHSLKKYEALSQIEDHDFFARFTYKPSTKEFDPDRVPVYCLCEQPYNPDRAMLMCDRCEEWFHQECLQLPQNFIRSLEGKMWVCNECQRKQRLPGLPTSQYDDSVMIMPESVAWR